MDLCEMRRGFIENINLMIRTKRDDNKSFLNVDEYNYRIGEVKEAKTLLLTPGSKKTTKHYRMVRKYDVITISGRERLIKPVTETALSKVLYYATNEELFDIIHNAHLAIGHGGRNRMVAEINKLHCNITKETIMVYLRLCAQCQKKSGSPRKGLVSRPILHSKFNSLAQVDLIDMQSQSYNDFRFIMLHQDHLTKFLLLKPLKAKTAEEVAFHLLDIYTTFGAPLTLHSDMGQEFINSVLVELHVKWPDMKIVHGKPRHSQSQGCVGRVNRDIKEMLEEWMVEHKTTDWLTGIKIVQFKKNRALHSGIGRSPYEAMFRYPARTGLDSAGIFYDEITKLSTEEDIESFIKEEPKELEDNSNSEREDDNDEENEVQENIKLEPNAETLIETSYEDRIDYKQCSTVLPSDKEVNDVGICLNCQRQENLNSERKRFRGESIDKQTSKILKLSDEKFSAVQIGTTVCVPVPDVDIIRSSPRNVLAVVSCVEDGLYKLCTKNGVIKHKFTRSEFKPSIEKFILLENLSDSVKKKEITLRQAAALNSILWGQGYERCHCKGGCKNNKCTCRASKKECVLKCHGTLSCHNKND